MDFICFDTEDNSKELADDPNASLFDRRVTQIAAMAGDGSEFYAKGDGCEVKFVKWVEKRPETRIYALNTQYDLGNLTAAVPMDRWDITLVKGRLIKAVGKEKQFLDVFNLYQMSVAKLGECFGLEKGEFDADSRDYVFRDVEIIHRAITFVWQMAEAIGVLPLPSTIAGLAMKVWKAWGGYNYHDSSTLSRAAYYGGRVELFKPRNTSKVVAYTDINSLYPSAMLGEFPLVMEDFNDLPKWGVADVTIKTPDWQIAVLPFRNAEGEILYPRGKFRGVWTCHEIRAAVERGATILELHQAQGCNEAHRPYAEFVQRCYELRLASSNEAEKTFFKLLMNNLYGRLSISGEVTRSVHRSPETEDKGDCYGEKVLVTYKMPLAEETNWSHGAHVTSYGRLRLLEFLEKIGAKNLIYCDTDSAIFDCPSKKIPFKTSMDLGEMKLERDKENKTDFWPGCEVFAPKCYKLGKHYKAKGVPRSLAKEFLTEGHCEFRLPFKLRESIRFYDRGNSKPLSHWRKVVKQMQKEYRKKDLKNGHFIPCKV